MLPPFQFKGLHSAAPPCKGQSGMAASLEGWHTVLGAEDGQQVVAEGVCHVLGPVGVRALARHIALHGEALRTQ